MAKIAVLRVTRQITGEALFVCLLHCAWMSLDMADMAGPLWGCCSIKAPEFLEKQNASLKIWTNYV